ncbi:hypothetical protein, partial [Agitococcus lubricus]
QKKQGGYFDEHKIMLGFLSQQQAIDTYQHCFERGWTGLMSVVPCTIEQLKWWLANGDKSRPVTVNRLPYAGLERLDSVIWGGQEGTDLASHSGQVHKLLYQIRQSDNSHHALEPMLFTDMVQELGNQGFVYENYDALVTEYNKLERKAQQLLTVMQAATTAVKPVRVVVSKPLTKNGVANVIAWFEMDDGQAVGVFFHNPDKNPKKLDPTDEMISYKWVLNKKDITIAVAPEQGKDLNVRTVAKRIMQLVDKNHDRFMKANSAKAELNIKEQDLNAQVIAKQSQLDMLNKDIEALEAQKAEKEVNKPVIEQTIEQEQERPADYRTNLANARAVAKSLGIETKGKKLDRLLKDIAVFDENEVKKELLAEFKALASRLVLPKGYVFDLTDAEKSIDNAGYLSLSAWIKKQGKTDTNSIRVELRTVPRDSYGEMTISNFVFIYTDDQKTKKDFEKFDYQKFGDIGGSSPKTPKAIVAKMEDFLTKAIFPKIEYLKIVNSTNVDSSKLSEIGIAEITDIGDENLYFEKDGKYYVSKVGNPQLYALGEWDFAKYPDGKFFSPELSNKKSVFEALTQYGWSLDAVSGGISKKFAGLAEAGDISDGSRILSAYFDSRERYLAVTDNNAPTGGAIITETEIDLRDYGYNVKSFEKAAKAFNEKVEAYVLKRRELVNTPKSNPDRDYLQSIIDGKADLSNADEIEAKLTDIGDRLNAELEPLFEQAAEAFAQYAIAQAATV